MLVSSASAYYDTQALGWLDDGSEQGRLRVLADDLGWVRVPFREAQFAGPGSWAAGPASGGNPAGANTNVGLTTTAGLPSSTYNLRHTFRGRVYGVMFDPQFATSGFMKDFAVIIDGVCYRVPKQLFQWDTQAVWSVSEQEFVWIVATDLEDRLHWAEIVETADATSQNGNLFFGYVVERRVGYRDAPPALYPASTTTLTTSQVAVIENSNSGRYGRGIRKIIYTNTSGGAVTVTVQILGVTVWQKSIAAGDSAEFDPGGLLSMRQADLKHAAGAATSINATIMVQQ